MANPLKRYKSKLAHLLKNGFSASLATRMARSYAGGKTKYSKDNDEKKKYKAEEEEGKIKMPYASKDQLPESIRNVLPADAQDIWMGAYNSAKENGSDDSESASIAWTAVQNAGFSKDDDTGNWVKAVEVFNNVVALQDIGGEEDETWVEILKTGEWDHPRYGKIIVKEQDLDKFIYNFNNNIRGVDLAVDQAHKPDEGAAGWFKELRKDGPRLMAKVQWTPVGKWLLENNVFRYFSPEFSFKYKDPEKGKEYRNVLFGGALTNRPFIKGMAPVLLDERIAEEITAQEIALITDRVFFGEAVDKNNSKEDPFIINLSEATGKTVEEIEELFAFQWQRLPEGWTRESLESFWDSVGGSVTACMEQIAGRVDDPAAFCASIKDVMEGTVDWRGSAEADERKMKGAKKMTLEEIKQALGLGENDTPTEAQQQIIDAFEALQEASESSAVLSETAQALNLGEESGKEEILKAVNDLKQKAEERRTASVSLEEENQKLNTRLKNVENQLLESEWREVSQKAMSEGRLTAKQAEVFKVRYMNDPESTKEILDLMEPIIDVGEFGSSREQESNLKAFSDEVSKKMKEDSLTYEQALLEVQSEQPALWEAADQERKGLS